MTSLWQKILETDAVIYIAYSFGIVIVGLIAWLLQSCGGLVESLTDTAHMLDHTLKEIDRDSSGAISMQEIIQYCLLGWVGGRGAETAGRMGVKRFKNGRQRNDRSSSASSEA